MKSPRQQPQWGQIAVDWLNAHGDTEIAGAISNTLNTQQLLRAAATGIISHYLSPEHFATHGVEIAPLIVVPEKTGGIHNRLRSRNESRLLIGGSVTRHSITIGRTLDYADWSHVREFPRRTVRFGNHVYAFPLSHTQVDAASQPYLLSNGYIGESLPLTEDGKPQISSDAGENSEDDRFLQLWTRSGYSPEGAILPVVEALDITAMTYYDIGRLSIDLGDIVQSTLRS